MAITVNQNICKEINSEIELVYTCVVGGETRWQMAMVISTLTHDWAMTATYWVNPDGGRRLASNGIQGRKVYKTPKGRYIMFNKQRRYFEYYV